MTDSNDTWLDRYYDVLCQAANLDASPAKVALLEEAVRIADAHQDIDCAFDARLELVQAATFCGMRDHAMVAFSWCLAQADREPDKYSWQELLWRYKWIINSLDGFPQVSQDQIEAMLADMQKRFLAYGAGLRAVYQARANLARSMGQRRLANQYFRKWQSAPRDCLADCPACERNREMTFAIFQGKDERAVQLAEPIVRGLLRCKEIPHATYSQLLLPLLRLGRPEEAAQYHRKGLRLTNGQLGFVDNLAEHLTFAALTCNLPQANRIFEKNLGLALQAVDLSKRFDFYLASVFLLERWKAEHKTQLKSRLPRDFPLYQESGRYDVESLWNWFSEQSRELARRFDARNGNDYFSKRIRELKKLHRLAAPHPI